MEDSLTMSPTGGAETFSRFCLQQPTGSVGFLAVQVRSQDPGSPCVWVCVSVVRLPFPERNEKQSFISGASEEEEEDVFVRRRLGGANQLSGRWDHLTPHPLTSNKTI